MSLRVVQQWKKTASENYDAYTRTPLKKRRERIYICEFEVFVQKWQINNATELSRKRYPRNKKLKSVKISGPSPQKSISLLSHLSFLSSPQNPAPFIHGRTINTTRKFRKGYVPIHGIHGSKPGEISNKSQGRAEYMRCMYVAIP